jgi:hypothetical protein
MEKKTWRTIEIILFAIGAMIVFQGGFATPEQRIVFGTGIVMLIGAIFIALKIKK